MRLTDLFSDHSLRSTIYGERYLNDSKGSFSSYSEVAGQYDPQGPLPYIDMPYTLLRQDQCSVFRSQPSEDILNWVIRNNQHRFLWHPAVDRQSLTIEGFVRTQPTSSTRTVLTEQAPFVYVKTDLDKKHFRFIRRLQRSSVEHSIAICSDLRDLCTTLAETSRYAFLPESLGIVVRGGDHEGSGVIFREILPSPVVKDQRVIMPYHSLYAPDPNPPADKPLLIQIVELHGGCDKLQYFVSEVIGPILEAWVMLVHQRGLLPELHGQNSLAEIDRDLRIRRVVHRDFQGTYSDSRIRINLGLPVFTKHIVGTEPGTTVESQYSHVFDGMIGRYLLSRLVKTYCNYLGGDYNTVTGEIRNYHHSLKGWDEASFPTTIYRFGDTANQQVGNDVQLVDSGQKPEFR